MASFPLYLLTVSLFSIFSHIPYVTSGKLAFHKSQLFYTSPTCATLQQHCWPSGFSPLLFCTLWEQREHRARTSESPSHRTPPSHTHTKHTSCISHLQSLRSALLFLGYMTWTNFFPTAFRSLSWNKEVIFIWKLQTSAESRKTRQEVRQHS